MSEAQTVIDLIAAHHAAIAWHDAEAALDAVAPAATVFSLAPPLVQDTTPADGQAGLQVWMEEWTSGPDISLVDPKVRFAGDLAVAWGLARMRGAKAAGEAGLWYHKTIMLERAGAAWHIVHSHESMPFMMDGSLRAAVDLQP